MAMLAPHLTLLYTFRIFLSAAEEISPSDLMTSTSALIHTHTGEGSLSPKSPSVETQTVELIVMPQSVTAGLAAPALAVLAGVSRRKGLEDLQESLDLLGLRGSRDILV